MKLRFTPIAQADIAYVYGVIEADDPAAARRVEDRIRRSAETLALLPGSGSPTDIEGVRRLPLVRFPYTIFYRVNVSDDVVEILRVVHGARVKNVRQVPH
jgi:toxin ParE1/3/4